MKKFLISILALSSLAIAKPLVITTSIVPLYNPSILIEKDKQVEQGGAIRFNNDFKFDVYNKDNVRLLPGISLEIGSNATKGQSDSLDYSIFGFVNGVFEVDYTIKSNLLFYSNYKLGMGVIYRTFQSDPFHMFGVDTSLTAGIQYMNFRFGLNGGSNFEIAKNKFIISPFVGLSLGYNY